MSAEGGTKSVTVNSDVTAANEVKREVQSAQARAHKDLDSKSYPQVIKQFLADEKELVSTKKIKAYAMSHTVNDGPHELLDARAAFALMVGLQNLNTLVEEAQNSKTAKSRRAGQSALNLLSGALSALELPGAASAVKKDFTHKEKALHFLVKEFGYVNVPIVEQKVESNASVTVLDEKEGSTKPRIRTLIRDNNKLLSNECAEVFATLLERDLKNVVTQACFELGGYFLHVADLLSLQNDVQGPEQQQQFHALAQKILGDEIYNAFFKIYKNPWDRWQTVTALPGFKVSDKPLQAFNRALKKRAESFLRSDEAKADSSVCTIADAMHEAIQSYFAADNVAIDVYVAKLHPDARNYLTRYAELLNDPFLKKFNPSGEANNNATELNLKLNRAHVIGAAYFATYMRDNLPTLLQEVWSDLGKNYLPWIHQVVAERLQTVQSCSEKSFHLHRTQFLGEEPTASKKFALQVLQAATLQDRIAMLLANADTAPFVKMALVRRVKYELKKEIGKQGQYITYVHPSDIAVPPRVVVESKEEPFMGVMAELQSTMIASENTSIRANHALQVLKNITDQLPIAVRPEITAILLPVLRDSMALFSINWGNGVGLMGANNAAAEKLKSTYSTYFGSLGISISQQFDPKVAPLLRELSIHIYDVIVALQECVNKTGEEHAAESTSSNSAGLELTSEPTVPATDNRIKVKQALAEILGLGRHVEAEKTPRAAANLASATVAQEDKSLVATLSQMTTTVAGRVAPNSAEGFSASASAAVARANRSASVAEAVSGRLQRSATLPVQNISGENTLSRSATSLQLS